MKEKKVISGTSLCIFSKKNLLRARLGKIAKHENFETFILAMIIFSTITLTLEHPLDNPEALKVRILSYIDIAVSTIFILEAIIKILTFGFLFNGRDSYLRSAWNIMDFVIVCCSVSLYLNKCIN